MLTKEELINIPGIVIRESNKQQTLFELPIILDKQGYMRAGILILYEFEKPKLFIVGLNDDCARLPFKSDLNDLLNLWRILKEIILDK